MLLSMTVRRIIGLVMLVAAVMFGLTDIWHTYVPTYGSEELTLGRLWDLISASSMNFVQSLFERHFWSPVWEFGISPMLVVPAWMFFLGLGFLFFTFGRPKVAG
jgi:hypothetical protein